MDWKYNWEEDDYHVILLATYLDDNYLCDDTTRWWPELHEYVLNDNNVPVCKLGCYVR